MKRFALIFLILSILLTSCGKEDKNTWTVQKNIEKYWEISDSVSIPEDINIRSIVYKQNAVLYRSDEEKNNLLISCPYENQSGVATVVLEYPDTENNTDCYFMLACDNGIDNNEFLSLWRVSTNTEDNEHYKMVRYNPSGAILYDITTGTMAETFCEIPIDATAVYIDEEKILAATANGLYCCDIENRCVELLLEWSAVGLKSNNISKIVSASEDMVIICGYEENAYTIWKLTTTDMFDERTVITLMTGNESAWWLTDCVYEFNKLNEEYRVVLDNPTAGLEKEDVSTRQQLLLTSSTPPDLVDLSFVENWKEYAANGVFEDLSAYFQNSNILDENEYLPNILEGGKIGEEQIFIPYSFGFTMLYGQEQYLGKEGGWTLQDLLELYHEHEEISILNYESTLALESLLSLSMEEFVDYSQVSCDFEVPLFYDLLQCTAKARYTEGDYTMFCSNVLENRALMDEAIIFNMESYLAYTGLMEENTSDSGTKLVLKGYPSKDGKMRGEAYFSPSTYFGICSNSDNKEGAWQFLEYLLSCEDYFVDAFPSRRDWLIKRMNSCNPDYFAGVEELREITKEDEEQLLSIIEGLNFTSNQDKNIIQVVTEEAQEYYEGDKSEEEVAKIIQNRIQLYLWENSD